MSNYKEGLDSILQAINNLITPQLVSLKYDKTFRGKITSIIDNGLYEVQVNGRSYTLPYAGTLQVGDIVKVKSPLNNFSDIYIEAIGGSGGGQKTHKYKMSGSPMKEVLPGGKITLPCTYKVGAGVLDIYFNGELLILSADASGSNGHYLEVGTTGSISNEIQLTSDWGTGTDYYLAIVVRGEYIATPSLITFTLGDYQCQAEEGMTFGTWANSTYNVDNKFYISDTKPYYLFDETNRRYVDNLEDGSQDFVAKDTIIVANKTYPVYVGGPIK